MTSLDLTEVKLQHLITHHVGNKLRDEKFLLSSDKSTIAGRSEELLLKYFLLPIKSEEFFSFSHPVKLELNEVYTVAKHIFNKPKSFIDSSQNIAKLLYEQSMHPKIKQGELNVAYFSNASLNQKTVNAIGIFKSESDVPFLKMENQKSRFFINHDYGYELNGMDKGCIIFNTGQDTGYQVLIVDNANKSEEAQYWKDNFLKVKPISDSYHFTKDFLSVTKEFVTRQFPEEFEVSKSDQIDLLNRSVDYFKSREEFNKKEFESEVLQDTGIIKSFRKFNEAFKDEIYLSDNFTISNQAVKKQSRIFKSVLKLDKNFHVYIHGNKEMIERGYDEQKRLNYYKIYFKEEF